MKSDRPSTQAPLRLAAPEHRLSLLRRLVRALEVDQRGRIVDDIEEENDRGLKLIDHLMGATVMTPEGPMFELWDTAACDRLALADEIEATRRSIGGAPLEADSVADLLERRYQVQLRQAWYLGVWRRFYADVSTVAAS